MASLSAYLRDALVDHTLGTSAFTMPANIYVSLYTTNPTINDTGTEVSAGGYARQVVTFSASSGGTTSNPAAIEFGPASASWGTITHIGIHDASTAGNLIVFGALAASKAIADGDALRFLAESIDFTLA